VGDIGCGVGQILFELSQDSYFSDTTFVGYDVSPHAIDIASKRKTPKLTYRQIDLLDHGYTESFDVLLVIDVVEHIRDCYGFLEKCKAKASFKVFHFPLDLHVSGLIRNTYMRSRYTVGHLHYFTADHVTAILRDTGYEILESTYTSAALDLYRLHPSIWKALANVPRSVVSWASTRVAARLFGGYSFLILAR
jgi:SAM-dependent methyltransferase